jgi:hypothetical protein
LGLLEAVASSVSTREKLSYPFSPRIRTPRGILAKLRRSRFARPCHRLPSPNVALNWNAAPTQTLLRTRLTALASRTTGSSDRCELVLLRRGNKHTAAGDMSTTCLIGDKIPLKRLDKDSLPPEVTGGTRRGLTVRGHVDDARERIVVVTGDGLETQRAIDGWAGRIDKTG